MNQQQELARRFRGMHARPPVVLPNAWDALSARAMELAGANAIATTSGGVSWAHGTADGQGLGRDDMCRAVARIVRAVAVPVTADVESGYGSGSADDVAETARAAIAAGAVGINVEDAPGSDGRALLARDVQAERIAAARAAARAAGVDLFINARTDVYLRSADGPQERLDAAVERGNAYLAAGADCVFVPGVVDLGVIATLAEALAGPLNVIAGPGAPSIAELGRAGVTRVSLGCEFAQAAIAATREAARELLERGTYDLLRNGMPYPEANALFPGAGHHAPRPYEARP
jgi:2-methylisocitrate lyase-like PEP mutase family enzyme